MKAYILFAGDHYYPIGGWRDKKLETDSIEEAIEESNKFCERYPDLRKYDWADILDTATGEIIYSRCNETINSTVE